MTEADFEEPPHPPPPPPKGFEDFVRRNPVGAVVGALIAGILLGRLGIF